MVMKVRIINDNRYDIHNNSDDDDDNDDDDSDDNDAMLTTKTTTSTTTTRIMSLSPPCAATRSPPPRWRPAPRGGSSPRSAPAQDVVGEKNALADAASCFSQRPSLMRE